MIVENYKAIGYAELNFVSGLYKVIGINNDSTYTSNGAAKSSILQAIVLGLYNKDFSGVPLEALSNRFTGKPYNITIELSAMYEGEVRDIVITNPAGSKRMRMDIKGKEQIVGAVAVVPLVEKILGMGYSTFKLTHFITSTTIIHLTQNLSQPTLFNDILHLVELQELDKKLLQLSKDVAKELSSVSSKVEALENNEKLLAFKSKYDKVALSDDLTATEEMIEALDSKYFTNANVIKTQLDSAKADLAQQQKLIDQAKTSLRSGVCSVCGSLLVDRETLESLNASIIEYESAKSISDTKVKELSSRLMVLDKKYKESRAELVNHSNSLKQDLGIANEIAELHTDDAELSDLPKMKLTLSELKDKDLFIQFARKEIKNGSILRNVLDQFFSIVTVKMQEYLDLIKLDHFTIRVVNDKLGMAVQLNQNGLDVPIDSLSNGERTRLSLLVLIAMLDAMKVVSESETNLVVFDEASSSFDASGVEELSNLFSHLKALGQACFIITHGSEMDSVPYDYTLTMTKNNGVSSITVSEI